MRLSPFEALPVRGSDRSRLRPFGGSDHLMIQLFLFDGPTVRGSDRSTGRGSNHSRLHLFEAPTVRGSTCSRLRPIEAPTHRGSAYSRLRPFEAPPVRGSACSRLRPGPRSFPSYFSVQNDSRPTNKSRLNQSV